LRSDKRALPAIPARSSLAQRSVTLPVSFRGTFKTFEPLSIDGSNRSDFALDLNKASEGIGVMPPTVVRQKRARPAFEPLIVGEILTAGIADELNRQNEGLEIKPEVLNLSASSPRQPQTPPLLSFAVLETSENLYFSGPIDPLLPVVPVTVGARDNA